MRKDTTLRENRGPGPRGTEPELLGAGNGQQAPITIKVAFLGSMLEPLALFNTGYRHEANLLFRSIGHLSSTRIYRTIHTNSRSYGSLFT
eukprot:scaffold5530_cov36-Attheya_sp.AAC.1